MRHVWPCRKKPGASTFSVIPSNPQHRPHLDQQKTLCTTRGNLPRIAMFRHIFILAFLHILGFEFFSMVLTQSQETMMDHSKIGKAENMDCATVGPINNVCLMLTPMPDQTGVRATLMIGDRQIVSTMLTGRNPPGFPCVPIVVPILTAACLQMRDVQLTRGGFQTCPEAALVNVAVVRFRCIVVGPQGVAFQTVNTPNTNGGIVEIDL